MGGALCALQTAATAVRDWAVQGAKAVAYVFKSIWNGFANFMSKVVDFTKYVVSKFCFQLDYSNRTTSVSTSPQRVQVNQRNFEVKVGYNRDLIKEKEEELAYMENLSNVVNQSVDLKREEVEQLKAPGDNPFREQEKLARKMRQFMDGDEVRTLLNRMHSAPCSLAY